MSLDASLKTGASVRTGEQAPAGNNGGSTLVHSGTAITVDNSDPANPIVNNSGVIDVAATDATVIVAGSAHHPTFSAPGVQTVATLAALGSLASALFVEGARAYVQSAKAQFVLVASSAAARTNVRIAASGKTGYQWVRLAVRNPVYEVQAAWFIDTGAGSDDATGADSGNPLLTYNELAFRLAYADIAQTTTVTITGDQQTGDDPTFTYVPRGLNLMNFVGSPTVLYSSTVTSYSAAGFLTTDANDNQLVDAAVPGGTFTAAGALAKGVFLKRTNGTVIYAAVLKDLGGTTCRVAQPFNPASGTANVSFAAADAYQLIKLPRISSLILPMNGNSSTKLSFFDWNVGASANNGLPGVQMVVCYLEKVTRSCGLNNTYQGCCIDVTGGGSFEGGSPVFTGWTMNSFKGSGATLYGVSGANNSEGTVTSLQGCKLLVESGTWNGGQFSAFDTTVAAVESGTAARIHMLAPISGKGNTSKLAKASQSSQIVSSLAISTGNFFTAASTTDANPIQAGATVAAVAIPLDANMNGVFQTA